MERQTGRTTRQMQAAPHGSVFVWCNAQLLYPKQLAVALGRKDLDVVSPSWLEQDRWRGRTLTGLEVDHAANLSGSQWDAVDLIRFQIK